MLEEEVSVGVSEGARGVPDMGEFEVPRLVGSAVRVKGSAECWRLSWGC